MLPHVYLACQHSLKRSIFFALGLPFAKALLFLHDGLLVTILVRMLVLPDGLALFINSPAVGVAGNNLIYGGMQ